MFLAINLSVKFRAFLITFANFKQDWNVPLPVPIPAAQSELVNFNKQGVSLVVTLK